LRLKIYKSKIFLSMGEKLLSLVVEVSTVAHTCDVSHLGGGDLEDDGSRPAWTKK
jgi:hypothetical protein